MSAEGNNVSVEFLRRKLEEQSHAKGGGLKGGNGNGTSGGMETRVSNLEKRFDRFEAKLDTIVKDVSEMKGRVSAMPTTWQLLGMVLAIMAASFAIIRFGLAGM